MTDRLQEIIEVFQEAKDKITRLEERIKALEEDNRVLRQRVFVLSAPAKFRRLEPPTVEKVA